MEESTYLPLDIIVMILSRLPAKSLLRFKAVCKSWNTLISSPSFIHTHLLHSKTSNSHTRFIIKSSDEKFRFFQLQDGKFLLDQVIDPDMSELPSWYHAMLCSCNGVLLLQGNSREELVLWNPSIGKIDKLHIPFRFHGLVGYGICYDTISTDLKIVVAELEKYVVYSCKNRSWSKPRKGLVSKYGYRSFIHSMHMVCVNGAVYWKSHSKGLSGEYCRLLVDLVCYESEKDELKWLQKPQSLKRGDEFFLISVRDEFGILFWDVEECVVRIWMKEVEGWTEFMKIENVPHLSRWLFPLHIEENEIVVCLEETRRILCYRPCEKTYEEYEGGWTFYNNMARCIDSLVFFSIRRLQPSRRKRMRISDASSTTA